MARRARRTLYLLAAVLVAAALYLLSGTMGDRRGGGTDRDAAAGNRLPTSVTGRVLTASGGAPPSGTRVIARGPGATRETRTDAEGGFRLEAIPSGAVALEAVAGPLRATVPRETFDGRIRLPPVFDAAGRIVDAETGGPVAGAEVVCGVSRTVTDGRGRFRLEDVAAPGGVPPSFVVRSPEHQPLQWRPAPDAAWDDLYTRLLRR